MTRTLLKLTGACVACMMVAWILEACGASIGAASWLGGSWFGVVASKIWEAHNRNAALHEAQA